MCAADQRGRSETAAETDELNGGVFEEAQQLFGDQEILGIAPGGADLGVATAWAMLHRDLNMAVAAAVFEDGHEHVGCERVSGYLIENGWQDVGPVQPERAVDIASVHLECSA